MNLKRGKREQSEPEIQAPQELVMAGGQTPWSRDLPPASGPFGDAGTPEGMPAMPPPPPSYAPGEEPQAEADAPGGRKLPLGRPMILALAAVVVLGGGGYYYLNMSSSSSTAKPAATAASNAAKFAALRAAAAAKAAGAGAVKPPAAVAGAVKPPVTPVKPAAAAAKAPVAAAKVAPAAKAPVAAKAAAAAKPAFTFTAALPGQIGEWPEIPGAKIPFSLAKFDADLGGKATNIQSGIYGDSATAPYLLIQTGDHTGATNNAMTIAKAAEKELRAAGIAVADAIPVPHVPWGGTAACGTATANDILEVYCVWTDNNTFGMVAAPHRAQSDAVAILNMTRGAVEH